MSRSLATVVRRARFVALLAVQPIAPAQSQSRDLVAQNHAADGHVTFSPDGRLYATIGECCTSAFLWETATGRLVRELTNPGNAHEDVVFSPDGRLVAATSVSLRHRRMNLGRLATDVVVWKVEDGGRVEKPSTSAAEILTWGVSDSVPATSATPVRDSMAFVSADGSVGVRIGGEGQQLTVSVRSLASGVEVARLPETFPYLQTLALSPDGRFLVLSSRQNQVDVWDVAQVRRVATLEQQNVGNAVAFTRDGSLLALGGAHQVQLYRTATWSPARAFAIDSMPLLGIRDVSFSRDARLLAVAGDNVRIIDVTTGRELPRPMARVDSIDAWALGDSVLAVARSPKPRPMHADPQATIELWSLGGAKLIGSQLLDVVSLALSADGRQVAAGMMAATLWSRYTQAFEGGYWFWDGEKATTRVSTDFDSHRNPISDVVFSPSAKSLLAATYDPIPTKRTCAYVACGEDESTQYNVRLSRIDPQSGSEKFIAWMVETELAGGRVALSPRGDRALVLRRGGFRVLDAVTGAIVSKFVMPTSAPYDRWYACAETPDPPGDVFSESGRRVMIAHSAGGTVVDARTGQIVRQISFRGDSEPMVLSAVRFIGDSALAMVTCADRLTGSTLRRFDLTTGTMRAVAHFDALVRDVLIRPDGSFLVHNEGVIRLYSDAGELRATLLFGTDGEWLVVTPSGRYDASAGGTSLAVWRSGSTLTSIEQIPGAEHVPGLLRQVLWR